MRAASRTVTAALLLTLSFCFACGGSSSPAPVSPVFSLAAPGTASEGTQFTYTLQATESDGGSVSFALLSAPEGATLSGATISWTPTHAQARKANPFTVQATSKQGATTSASFSITPTGTIRGTAIASYWSSGSSVQVPLDLSAANTVVRALVPDGNGNYTTCAGQGAADGSFSIPNVPAGYFWLQAPASILFWTNSSDVDLGLDLSGHPGSGLVINSSITGNFDLTGLDPWLNLSYAPSPSSSYSTLEGVSPESTARIGIMTNAGPILYGATPPITDGSAAFSGQLPVALRYFPVETAEGDTSYILQSNSYYSGSWLTGRAVKSLGPLPLTLDASTSTVGISGDFSATTAGTAHFNIKSTGFVNSIAGTNPAAGSGLISEFGAMAVAPYTADRYAPSRVLLTLLPTSIGASNAGVVLAHLTSTQQVSDYDSGDIPFINPFPSPSQVFYEADQVSSVLIYQSGNSGWMEIGTSGYMTTTAPGAANPLDLPMGNVQSPQINGSSLFTASGIQQPVQLSWSAPAGIAPNGYKVQISQYSIAPCNGTSTCLGVVSVTQLFTGANSLTIPTAILRDGYSYVFRIQAIADASADFVKAPRRGSLNRAYSDVISNMITIGAPASATSPAPVAAQNTGVHTLYVHDGSGTVRRLCPSENDAAWSECTR